MARKEGAKSSEVVEYRHQNASRVNIPPAGLAAWSTIAWEMRAPCLGGSYA